MDVKSEGTIPCTIVFRGPSTNLNTLQVIPSQKTCKNEKVVIGDKCGNITCFKCRKDFAGQCQLEHIFVETRPNAICGVIVNEGCVYVSHGQVLEGFKKKGKPIYKLKIGLNECITSFQFSADNKLHCVGGYVYNCYENEKDIHFFMANDSIRSLLLVDLGLKGMCPVLGCQDKYIRVLEGSQVLHDIPVDGAVLCLCEIPCTLKVQGETTQSKFPIQLIYGTEQGTLGQVWMTKEKFEKGWTVSTSSISAINCLRVYDFYKNELSLQNNSIQIMVGYDNGLLQIWSIDLPQASNDQVINMSNKPHIIGSETLHESITGIDVGYISGVTNIDIIVATYSGKVILFHCDPRRDFASWQHEQETKVNHLQTTLKEDSLCTLIEKNNLCKTQFENMKPRLQQEVDDIKKEIVSKKAKYHEKSKELIAVETQFELKHSLKLLPSEACHVLTLEIGIPIHLVCVQSSVKVITLDVEAHFGITTQHDDAQGNYYLACQADESSITRFSWKFRCMEGVQGELLCFVMSRTPPKTCQSIKYSLKALSLHSSFNEFTDQLFTPEKPQNTLSIFGDFNARNLNYWLQQCLPDVPTRLTTDNSTPLAWKCALTGSFLTFQFQLAKTCNICIRGNIFDVLVFKYLFLSLHPLDHAHRNNCAQFRSDSVASIRILQDFITKTSIKEGLVLSSVTTGFFFFFYLQSNVVVYFSATYPKYFI
ncbi:hypothetical protein RFI_12719 [Reticulomyxa filosa]|uniref:Uncharacterized protein n=1 Tax=Reticulomyxa filosa TaxID=46433 RepID=X6NEQ1_RETFI|nr:hypothetical protein RFI_12719 [Reticulomyxa filosa]|eukprot:ETO24441.1 hypothetical protein RFI_12719 [Reticulomyxa filosa]